MARQNVPEFINGVVGGVSLLLFGVVCCRIAGQFWNLQFHFSLYTLIELLTEIRSLAEGHHDGLRPHDQLRK